MAVAFSSFREQSKISSFLHNYVLRRELKPNHYFHLQLAFSWFIFLILLR